MEIKPKIDTEFVECDTCRKKAGSPILCEGCLKNRQIISNLVEYINKTK